jgi:hypothetical protein
MRTNASNFYTGINLYLAGIPTYYRPWAVSIPLTSQQHPNIDTDLELATPHNLLNYSHKNSLPLTTTRLNILRHYRLLQPIMAYPVIWQDRDLDRYLVTESTAKKEIIDHLFTGDWYPRTQQNTLSTSH